MGGVGAAEGRLLVGPEPEGQGASSGCGGSLEEACGLRGLSRQERGGEARSLVPGALLSSLTGPGWLTCEPCSGISKDLALTHS